MIAVLHVFLPILPKSLQLLWWEWASRNVNPLHPCMGEITLAISKLKHHD